MPIDINLLRESGNPEKVRESERRRFRDTKLVDEVIQLDKDWVAQQFQEEQVRKQVNKIQKEITERKKSSKGQDKCEDLLAQKLEVEKQVAEQKEKCEKLRAERDAKLHHVGNLVSDDVPVSKDEELDNEIVSMWGEDSRLTIDSGCFKTPGFRPHYQLVEMLGAVECEAGVNIAGHRGYYLSGPGVLLNQALINFGIAFLHKRGYCPLQPPFFMKKEVMGKTAELKDFAESLYCLVEDRADPEQDRFLIATSEQPISALHMNKTLEEQKLPLRYAGVSTCFRKEAGSSGRDIRGIFRVHQFEKVEQFCLVKPETSAQEHIDMIEAASDFYKELQIPHRVVNIVSGELNDAAAKKFDLEAWFPGDDEGRGQWRELVSCSNCLDYQARALNIKVGFNKTNQQYVHMLNSTLCATERAMCCLVENYQTPDGLRVPKALQPFMLGMEFIPFTRPVPKEK